MKRKRADLQLSSSCHGQASVVRRLERIAPEMRRPIDEWIVEEERWEAEGLHAQEIVRVCTAEEKASSGRYHS